MSYRFSVRIKNITSLAVGHGSLAGVSQRTFKRESKALLSRFANTDAEFYLPTLNVENVPEHYIGDDLLMQGIIARCGDGTIFGVSFQAEESNAPPDIFMVAGDDMPTPLRQNLRIYARRIDLTESLEPQLDADGVAPRLRVIPAGWHTPLILD